MQKSERKGIRSVLLLNGGSPINVVPLRKALSILRRGKAVVVQYFGDRELGLVEGKRQIPSIISLEPYRFIPHRMVAVNKRNVMLRDHNLCQYCGRQVTTTTGTVDHVLPTSRGGTNTWDNVVCSCRRCNNRKDDKTPNEVGMRLRVDPSEVAVPDQSLYIRGYLNKPEYQLWSKYF